MAQDFAKIGIISIDPLVTFSRRRPAAPLGMASAYPELFRGRPSLHLVGLSWTPTDEHLREIVQEYARLSRELPDARIVVLGNQDCDLFRLTGKGVCAIQGNISIFVDERLFRPLPAYDFGDAVYDAIYVARFEPFKRHELAHRVANLALLYELPFEGNSTRESEIRSLLPGARYLNHEYGDGKHKWLDLDVVAGEINRARCGLCLSAKEGAMRASIEYLLCGVPVVSTKSIGGRDRYYGDPYTIIADDDPGSVAEAVVELGKRRLSKLDVRDHIGRIIGHERRNFIDAVNGIVCEVFGVNTLFKSLEAFVRARAFPIEDDRGLFETFAGARGVRLASFPI